MKLAPNLNPDGTPVAFAKLMAIEKVSQRPGRTTFRSLTAPFMPGAGMPIEHPPRAFGGHVMAQAVVAAGETLGKGVWSVHVSAFSILVVVWHRGLRDHGESQGKTYANMQGR